MLGLDAVTSAQARQTGLMTWSSMRHVTLFVQNKRFLCAQGPYMPFMARAELQWLKDPQLKPTGSSALQDVSYSLELMLLPVCCRTDRAVAQIACLPQQPGMVILTH